MSDDEFFDTSSEGEEQGFAPNSKYAYKREDIDVDRGLAFADEEEAEAANSQRAAIQSRIADEDYGFAATKKGKGKAAEVKANGTKKEEAGAKRKRDEPPTKKAVAVEKVQGVGSGDIGERQRVLEQQSPELVKLLQEYNVYSRAIQKTLQPLLDKVKSGTLPTEKGLSFLEMKMHLMLSYCMQVMFYSLMKVEGQQVQDHAVVENLVAVRTYIQKLRPLEQKLQYNITRLLQQAPDGGAAYKEATQMEAAMPVVKSGDGDESEESEGEDVEGVEGGEDVGSEGSAEESDEDIESAAAPAKRRKVSRQIEKNRGLVAHRSKKNNTPRVRNRIRAEKLDKKAKQLVKAVKPGVAQNYGGEKRISMGTTRSRKLT